MASGRQQALPHGRHVAEQLGQHPCHFWDLPAAIFPIPEGPDGYMQGLGHGWLRKVEIRPDFLNPSTRAPRSMSSGPLARKTVRPPASSINVVRSFFLPVAQSLAS